jgi:hypothetical protein
MDTPALKFRSIPKKGTCAPGAILEQPWLFTPVQLFASVLGFVEKKNMGKVKKRYALLPL